MPGTLMRTTLGIDSALQDAQRSRPSDGPAGTFPWAESGRVPLLGWGHASWHTKQGMQAFSMVRTDHGTALPYQLPQIPRPTWSPADWGVDPRQVTRSVQGEAA